MKKTVLFSVLALTASAFADGEMIAASQQRGSSQSMNYNNGSSAQANVVTLTSARPESDNGWYVFADALYWHADIGETEWAIKNPNTSASPIEYNVHELAFKWSWGFKAGIGANIDHDGWDTNLTYTWFRIENSNQAGVVAGKGQVIDNLGAFGVYTTGKINWDIHFSMFDWELGRWYYLSKNLAIRPHVGIKGGWINQDVHLKVKNEAASSNEALSSERYAAPLPLSSDLYKGVMRFKNDFWGVGPAAGVNTMWILGNAGQAMDHRFALFGDVGGALMYGHFSVKNKQTYTLLSGASTGGNLHGLNRNLAVTMLQGAMGLSWDTAFNRGRSHFTMKVGYELQYWLRQNQLVWLGSFASRDLTSGSSGIVAKRLGEATLAFQGATAEFRFDF